MPIILLRCFFCSARLGRCDFTFACFALPRRHCSPASPTLGCQLNVWMTSLSVVFFLSFTFLLSFWVGSAFRYALIGMGIGGIRVARLGADSLGKPTRSTFYTPSRWLAFLIVFAIAARVVYGWWHATHSGRSAPGDQHWLTTASGTQLSLAIAAGLIGYYLRLLHWRAR